MENQKIGYGYYQELLDSFRELLIERLGNSLLSIAIYGSVARGEAGSGSDIDIVIVQKDTPPIYHKRLKPFIEVELKLRESKIYNKLLARGIFPCLAYLVLSQDELNRNKNLFLDMIENSIILFDREGFLKKLLEDLKHRIQELGSRKISLGDGSWYWDLKPDLVAGEIFEL